MVSFCNEIFTNYTFSAAGSLRNVMKSFLEPLRMKLNAKKTSKHIDVIGYSFQTLKLYTRYTISNKKVY